MEKWELSRSGSYDATGEFKCVWNAADAEKRLAATTSADGKVEGHRIRVMSETRRIAVGQRARVQVRIDECQMRWVDAGCRVFKFCDGWDGM